jgi:ABC-type multidrug transport system fused ATPase/permease subunit
MKIDTKSNSQKVLTKYLGVKFRRRYLTMMFLVVFGSALEAVSIAAVVPVIAVILNPDELAKNPVFAVLLSPFGDPKGDQIVIIVMTALGVTFLVKNAVLAAIAWFQTRFRESIQLYVSNKLFTDYMSRPYEWICKVPSSVLLRNLNESRAIVDYSIGPRLVLITESTISALLFVTLIIFEPIGSLLVALIVGLGALVFIVFSRNIVRRLGVQKADGDAKRIQIAQEALMGLREIRLYGITKVVVNRYNSANRERIQADQRYTFASTLPIYWLEMILMVGLVGLTITLVLLGRSSESIISFLALFTAAAFRILPSANRVITSMQALKFGKHQLEAIISDLSYESTPRNSNLLDLEMAEVSKTDDGEYLLHLRNVSFSYEDTQSPVFENLTISLAKGKKIGIIGQSGSGKTTLISLMCGLLPPTVGEVSVKGKVRHPDESLQDLRIAYASQDPYIIDGTVAENILFGQDNSTLTEKSMIDLLSSLGLSDFKLSDHLYEQGRSLSGGQKQRISLARALAYKPELLVLDEPTSAVDDLTEKLVIDTLLSVESDCSVLVVTHRPSILEICDEVYVLADGTLEAQR